MDSTDFFQMNLDQGGLKSQKKCDTISQEGILGTERSQEVVDYQKERRMQDDEKRTQGVKRGGL